MRALVTGFTASQCGRRTPRSVYTLAAALPALLRLAGVDVEQRHYVPGADDWCSFDVVYVGLAGAEQLTSGDRFSALAAVHEVPAERLRFYLDDWKFERVLIGARYVVNNPGKLIISRDTRRKFYDWATTNVDALVAGARRILEPWPLTVVPRFAWGSDLGLPDVAQHVLYVDPSWLLQGRARPGLKERRWISAALLHDETWLADRRCTWPVDAFGHKRRGQRVVAETEVLDAYSTSWGVLSLPHCAAIRGAGWWRNRFPYALDAGCVLLPDPRETERLHPGFAQPAHVIEHMTDAQLRDFQRWQWETFWRGTESIDSAVARVRWTIAALP